MIKEICLVNIKTLLLLYMCFFVFITVYRIVRTVTLYSDRKMSNSISYAMHEFNAVYLTCFCHMSL